MDKKRKKGDLLSYFSKRINTETEVTTANNSDESSSYSFHSQQETCRPSTTEPHLQNTDVSREQQSEETSRLTSHPHHQVQVEANDIGNIISNLLKVCIHCYCQLKGVCYEKKFHFFFQFLQK